MSAIELARKMSIRAILYSPHNPRTAEHFFHSPFSASLKKTPVLPVATGLSSRSAFLDFPWQKQKCVL
jgi:hypothetical protein